MATDFREFSNDILVEFRLAWLQLLRPRRKGSKDFPGYRAGHGIDLFNSQTDTGSNYRRFELAVFLWPTRGICWRSRLRSSTRVHPLPRLATIDIPPLSSLSRDLAKNLRSLFGGRVFLDTRNDHFNWTMDAARRLENQLRGKIMRGEAVERIKR